MACAAKQGVPRAGARIARNENMSPTPEQSLRQVLEATPGVRLAVLFGSAARGAHDEKSDLDVGVSFESGADAGPRLEVELTRVSHRRLDLVRLDEAPPLLRFEISRDGRLLLERVPHAWADFKARAMVDWWDWAPLARTLHASALKRVRDGPDVVRADVAGARIARAQAWLSDAEAILGRSTTDFVGDRSGRDLALFYLFLAIQECIDLAAHWVADEGWMPPDDAGSTFDVLADHRIIERPTADALRGATGLRNRIGHGYAMVDYVRVQEESRQRVPALRAFLDAVAQAAGL